MKKLIIHPDSRLLIVWDLVIMAVSVYIAIEIPLTIVFEWVETPLLIVFNWLVTLIYLLDIYISFNTAIYVQGQVSTDRRAIARKYLKSWFAIDLLAALPFVSLLNTFGRILKLLRLTRLLKLIRVTGTIQKTASSKINPALLRLFMLIVWILMVAHFISCAWIYISVEPPIESPTTAYIRAFYWTMTTLTTIGYGDITPQGNNQMVFVICIELLGAAMYGLIIGNIANLIANIDIAKTQFKERMKKVNTFLNYRNIPLDLKKKINDYYYYIWDSRHGYTESDILNDLPFQLKESVSLYLNKEIIEKVPLFKGAGQEFIKEIILSLIPVVFTPGDYIVKAGEVGNDMFFIGRGSVDVYSADEEKLLATLTEGHFFGEIALLLRSPRTATIKARNYCDLYRLEKETFDSILKKYPEFEKTITKLGQERKKETEAIKQKDISRKIENISLAVEEGVVKLEWEAMEEAQYYELIKKRSDDDAWKKMAIKVKANSYADNIETEKHLKVFYKIRAVYNDGAGPWSRVVTTDSSS